MKNHIINLTTGEVVASYDSLTEARMYCDAMNGSVGGYFIAQW